MKQALPILIGSIIFLQGLSAYGQQKDTVKIKQDTIVSNYSTYKRSITFSGLLQTRYIASLSSNVDVNGANFNAASASKISNNFLLKRARFIVTGNVNDHFSANLMMDLAEFNGNAANKVLDNAYIKYSLSKHFNIEAGQFRPFFGIEDAVANDIIRTLDYSNQYYAFGASGWQSFQVGIAILGTITNEGQLPLKYYVGAYNGNNRNVANDNDNTKNFYARLEVSPAKNLILGINGASGSLGNGTGYAWGGDIQNRLDLSSKWQLTLNGEFKTGNNFALFNTYTLKPSLSQVMMQGFYVFPIIRYNYGRKRVRAVEFSSRYEYFNQSYKLNSNPEQTIIPNVTLIFADDFYAALQLGVSIDMYQKDIPLTTTYTHNLAYVQFQVRF
ncbi:porin [Mucilaginibacter paludis]|nr:porin [Mucilaginibacter paludis]